MRISDSMKYRLFQSSLSKVSRQLTDLQTKIATGKKINSPSDDPIAYARAVECDSQLARSSQFSDNLERLKTLVSMHDTSLTNIESGLQQVADMANAYGTADEGLRGSYTQALENIIEQLVTVGNSKLGNSYIFGGQRADSAPLRLNSDYSVTYNVSGSAENAINIHIDEGQLGQFGLSGRESFYNTSKIAFGDVANAYEGDIYSNTDSFAYVVNTANNAIMVDGTAVNITAGVYSGNTLAQEIKTQLGADYSVAFDSTTRKFAITNNSGSDVTFNWSNAGATAATALGFSPVDSIVGTGGTETSDVDSGRKSFLVKINTGGATTGALASRATYSYSIDGGSTWSVAMAVSTGGADTTGDIVIDNTNNTLYRNGTAITLTNGTYTGVSLGAEIETRLGSGYSISYDSGTRKYSIINNTGSAATFNWSNSAATAAGVLGFDNVDSVVSNGNTDTGDYDAGMFIDGTGVANSTNNRIKLAFGTEGENLVANDTFQVKDLGIFEMLKNFKDAFASGDTTWVSHNIGFIDDARSLTVKNNAIVAFEGTQAETLIENNSIRQNRIEEEKSKLVAADMTELGIEFNMLLNTYQALLAAFSRMQSVSILNYLN